MTVFAYDALNRLMTSTFPDGSRTRQVYDAAGRVTQVVDQRGNTSSYEYGLAGNRTKITDALGGESRFTYDTRGNLETFTDANGHTTRYEYDAKNRRTRTDYPDGTSTSASYDTLDHRIAETDQAGITTSFAYDATGNLAQVTDALGGETRYGYDEEGNQTGQTDALGRETHWSYDRAGRAIRRTLPLGQTEQMAFDAAGNQVGHTDFNGDSIGFVYDNQSRLVEKQLPDGSSVQITYTPTGQRETVADAQGLTRYRYTGEAQDPETGFYYLRARYLNPGLGRFQTLDSWTGKKQEPLTLHKYLFANGNPVLGIDPSGNETLLSLTTAQNASFALLATATATYFVVVGTIEHDLGFPIHLKRIQDLLKEKANELAEPKVIPFPSEEEPLHRHHTIPLYMGGSPDQETVKLFASEHRFLHSSLVAYSQFFERVLDVEFRKDRSLFSYSNKSSLKLLAESRLGREAIVFHLRNFYSIGGWFSNRFPDFRTTFESEQWQFVDGKPPYPSP